MLLPILALSNATYMELKYHISPYADDMLSRKPA